MGAENPFVFATKIIKKSLSEIRGSSVDSLNEMAGRTIQRLDRRDLILIPNTPKLAITYPTAFNLVELPSATVPMYAAGIVIDMDKVFYTSENGLKANLVRTIAIADQFPAKGFERRFKQVYNDALDLQLKWLQSVNYFPIDLDPREGERENLLRSLLGDARYYTDVGFADWQAAIDDYEKSGQDPSVAPRLDLLRKDLNHFLTVRERFLPMTHATAMKMAGDIYLTEWDQEKRSQAAAYNLMGISLYASYRRDN